MSLTLISRLAFSQEESGGSSQAQSEYSQPAHVLKRQSKPQSSDQRSRRMTKAGTVLTSIGLAGGAIGLAGYNLLTCKGERSSGGMKQIDVGHTLDEPFNPSCVETRNALRLYGMLSFVSGVGIGLPLLYFGTAELDKAKTATSTTYLQGTISTATNERGHVTIPSVTLLSTF